jgi:mRNA-degrading endonuclease RelE of RelBE toxin-antitoxin system
MREYHYKPKAEENLADLNALEDLDTINDAVEELAAGTKEGFAVPLQSPFLKKNEILYQYQVGRYKLNYTLTKKELIVESVMV